MNVKICTFHQDDAVSRCDDLKNAVTFRMLGFIQVAPDHVAQDHDGTSYLRMIGRAHLYVGNSGHRQPAPQPRTNLNVCGLTLRLGRNQAMAHEEVDKHQAHIGLELVGKHASTHLRSAHQHELGYLVVVG